VFYNEKTNPILVDGILNERKVDQTLPQLNEVIYIGSIIDTGMILALKCKLSKLTSIVFRLTPKSDSFGEEIDVSIRGNLFTTL
jgi:hypothetical protein